jgi:hypothetical protein
MRATRPHGGRDQYCIGKTASSSRPKNSKLSRPDSKLFPPSEHSPYQPNLLLIMANVEIAKTESPGHADLPAVGVATIGPYTAARDRAYVIAVFPDRPCLSLGRGPASDPPCLGFSSPPPLATFTFPASTLELGFVLKCGFRVGAILIGGATTVVGGSPRP